MKKTHDKSYITLMTDEDLNRLFRFAIDEVKTSYMPVTYSDKTAEYIDKQRRIFFDCFVILQVEIVDSTHYIVEFVKVEDFLGFLN